MHEPVSLMEIARLEEARLALVPVEMCPEWRPLWGGAAGRADPGSWLNQAVNVGMGGPVDAAELEGVCAWWEAAGIEPRVELCPYADVSAVAALAGAGFLPRLFEGVFFRALGPDAGDLRGAVAAPPGVEVREVDKSDAGEVAEYARTVVPPFYPPGQTPTESDFATAERAVRHPRTVSLGAWAGGRMVAGGSMEFCGGLAALFGAAVEEGHRRRGIQSLLIAERLRLARERGARFATISARLSREPSGTERNARRAGFQAAYTKVILTRPREGLAPVRG